MKTYLKWSFSVNDEALLALLFTLPFESFEEEETALHGFITKDDCDMETEENILDFAAMFGAEATCEEIHYQNWNALWESNFSPVEVGSFCRIRADFHTDLINEFDHQITINPKMAFGTGHHQTTYMMIEAMEHIDFTKKNVLDYGCGTGILAILASRLGAKFIEAIDIEEESYRNTLENASINNVSNIEVRAGTLKDVMATDFEIVLANINRNVLLDTGEELVAKLSKKGILLLSGILNQDEETISEKYANLGWAVTKRLNRDNWMCLELQAL